MVKRNFKRFMLTILAAIFLSFSLGLQEKVQAANAGIAWQQDVGDIKFVLTNPHSGYAGPKFPNANHVNFHVYKKNSKGRYDDLANYHIVKYTSSKSSTCVYIWDSVSKTVVLDICSDSWINAAKAAAGAAKDFIGDVVDQYVDISYATWVAIIGALTSVISKADPATRSIVNIRSTDESTQLDQIPYLEPVELQLLESEG